MKMPEKYKKKFAQQLVEFLLVAPFLIIILGILTEYAYALNCNTTLSDGLKMVTGSIYSEISPAMTDDALQGKVIADLRDYLVANNVPTRQENTLTVSRTIIGDNAVFVANYKYISAFTLPNVFFHFLPDSFDFQAITIVPKAFMQGNSGYVGGMSSTDLDKIWVGTNFSGLSDFNKSKVGSMNSYLNSGILPPILFLVQSFPPVANTYNIVTWNGSVIDTLYMNTGNTSTGKNLLSAYPNCHTFIFTNDVETPSDLSNLHYYWTHIKGTCLATPESCQAISSSTPISDPTVDGILKRSLSLINSTASLPTSGGNFDNINVFAYNNEVAPTSSTYLMDTFGSNVFVHFAGESIANITNGQSATSKNYNFGDADRNIYYE